MGSGGGVGQREKMGALEGVWLTGVPIVACPI